MPKPTADQGRADHTACGWSAGKGRAHRAELSTEAIVDAAVRIALLDSLEELSLRKVARDLGRAPMSLYRHVSDVDHLIALVVERLIAQVTTVDHGEDWRRTLTETAFSMRDLLTKHPGILAVVMRAGITTPAMLQHINTFMGALVRSGLPDAEVVRAHAALLGLIIGSAVLRRSIDEAFPDGDDEMAHRPMLRLIADTGADHTHIAAVAESWIAMDHDEPFRFALDLLLDGIAVRVKA